MIHSNRIHSSVQGKMNDSGMENKVLKLKYMGTKFGEFYFFCEYIQN